MKKNLTFFLTFVLSVFGIMASLNAQELKYCGTTEMQKKLLEQFPELLLQQQASDQILQENLAEYDGTRDDQIYIIPIVFHIIHNYGVEAISEDQVKDAVRILNEDFRKLNPDTVDIVENSKTLGRIPKLSSGLQKKIPGADGQMG